MNEKLYKSLYRIRRVEEEVARIYPTDRIKSPVHLSIGQETISVGVCEALRPDDIVFGTYRGHALYLAKGGSLQGMMAELYGKATGCAKGKGGSMHLIEPEAGMMGTSAVVGTGIPQAVGYAFALKQKKSDAIVVVFFGDGAVEEGAFHESLNFASLKKLPILFVCENNMYSIHTPLRNRQPVDNIHERARSYGIPSDRIEDGDVYRIFERSRQMIREIRAGAGPRFLECKIYRWREHVGPNEDYKFGYRSEAEARPWIENDQVKRVGEALEPTVRKKIEKEVEAEIDAAISYAEASPFPASEELYTDVFKGV